MRASPTWERQLVIVIDSQYATTVKMKFEKLEVKMLVS